MSDLVQRTCNVCIVGTGAAGGILAYRLAEAGLDVISLDQGPRIPDASFTNERPPEDEGLFGIGPQLPLADREADQFFYANRHAASLYAAPDHSSLAPAATFSNRQIFAVGGKQNLWGGVALRYAPRDFRGREHGDSDVNWPIGYDDLEPHYAAIERLITVCGTRENLPQLPDGEFVPPKPLRPADELLLEAVERFRDAGVRAIPNRKAVETRPEAENTCRSCGQCIFGCRSASVYNFKSRLLPRIEGRSNYRLLAEMKVVRLIREAESDRIAAVECLNVTTGERFRVRADTFVLSAGAVESPRLLFNSRDEAFPEGLANSSGLVGRFLQDNVKVLVGAPLRRLIGARTDYDVGYGDNLLVPRFLFDDRECRGGYQAQFCHFVPTRPFYLQGMPLTKSRAIKERLVKTLFHTYVALMFFGRPQPSRDNRLEPGDSRDAFGVPQLDAHHAWSDDDRRMQQSMVRWGKRILKACSALVCTVNVDPRAGNAIHYAGTCRMGATKSEGVVEADLRTFDHPNLYVCDGSVFPDLSEKNLTLTIMALADRLAERLAARR